MALRTLAPTAALAVALAFPVPPFGGVPRSVSAGFRLTGDQVALIMGGSGVPTPTARYADSASTLYLQPAGFHGTPVVLTTPELFTSRENSEIPGADILTHAVRQHLPAAAVGGGDPVYVFGYSQSSALSALSMHQLHADGVPSDAVHFVLVGDPSTPNGGIFTAFGLSGGAYPDDMPPGNLYPADIYTMEYDPVSDWPRYSLNLLSDLNALNGLFFEHLAYLGLTPEQISGALPLATDPDSLVDYFVIPSQILPILAPLLLTPIIGKPLYDLLEPATRILVNLGYGSITEGWNSGPADQASVVSWAIPDMNWNDVSAALNAAVQSGFAAFSADLADPATYQLQNIVDSPALTELIRAEYQAGLIDTPNPDSFSTVLQGWSALVDPSTWLTS